MANRRKGAVVDFRSSWRILTQLEYNDRINCRYCYGWEQVVLFFAEKTILPELRNQAALRQGGAGTERTSSGRR